MMFLRNHQSVTEIDRSDVQKRIDQIILLDLARRNFTLDDFAEDTFTHFHFSLNSSMIDFWLPNTVS